jgi:radical SAM-linked protein
VTRLRVLFAKDGALRYTGHLDLHKIWERTARRAGLPLAYSQGFHPQPRLQLAAALPLGFSGRAEILDLWLEPGRDQTEDPESIRTALQSAAPPGLTVLQVTAVDEGEPALQTRVRAAEFEVGLLDPLTPADLEERLSTLLASTSLPRQRRGKSYDLRPLIEDLRLAENQPGEVKISMRLAAREGATGRPEEVLDALGIPFENTRVARLRLIVEG